MAMTALTGLLASLHLLRPDWLWALLAIVPAAVLWQLRRRSANAWRQSVDAHLLPGLLVAGGRRGWLGFVLAALTYALAVVAMSGLSWRQAERPAFHSSMPLVVVVDLSSSSNATDLPPSRLLQVRAKLATLLRKRAGGEVALLVYAGESFTVAPLTEDVSNVALFLDALSPSVMPVDGKRADRAIDAAARLLQQAGFKQGEILLLSDSADGSAESSARTARARGFRVSALGVGSARGAAYRTASGEIAQARLDEPSLRDLAGQGGGRYARIAPDDADLQALGVLDPAQQSLAEETTDANGGKTWLDEGYWLVLPVMALALLAFRRRAAVALLALVCVLPLAQPAQAADGTLWQRADQVQQQHLDAGVQAYRRGDFAAAQKAFGHVPTDEGLYNLGNALARQGRYDEAIAAYDRALKQHPNQADAIANRAAVDAARKRQQQGNKDGQGKSKDQNQSGQNKAGQNQQNTQGAGQNGQPPQDAQGKQEGKDPSSATPESKDGKTQAPQSSDGKGEPNTQDAPPQSADAKTQQQADEAQRRKMQQAMAQAGNKGADAKGKAEAAVADETPEQREQRQAVEAWLRRVPDDPGSLLRTKFRLEYERRQRDGR
ncbi:tetratricopeptide repeat protein [Xanthomonas axonopodis pv. poinsettiicola]|uniref:tetratricopeptide repeat protein n=1 Tax=Xanthomonas TaxID=338 RepID=UPI001E5B5DC2|nr:tetratricopeptide repeat protein [Xanthomonas codiaei]MCC8538615.1 VWA domain-containing protein [Xanthomonas codiaei]